MSKLVPERSIEDVQSHFEEWRSSRQKREPIPEELWEAVVDLSKRHPINEICRSLSLSHSNVKKRVLASGVLQESSSPVDFVDLGVFPPHSSSSCTVELTGKSGVSMKLCITGSTCIDIIELVHTFWDKEG